MSNESSELQPRVDALVKSAWGSRSDAVRITPLAGDASSRRYVRIALSGAGPNTAVVMIQSGSGLSISSDELAVFTEPLRELPFLNVQRYLRAIGIAVPEVYATAPDLVLLEDLGDTTLWEAARNATPDDVLDLYLAAIDELVRIQVGGERHPDSGCIAFAQRFDARLFLWELEHFLEYGFTGRLLADEDRAAYRSIFESFAEELAAEPLTLTHRDFHSWNLFVQGGRVRVIDFQDALLAPVPYDLATLLNDRATPTVVTPDREQALVEHFVRSRNERAGEHTSLEDFWPRYYRFLLQKSLKIVGRFHYLEEVKGRRGYVAMLPDTFATLRRCLANLPELRKLRTLLVRSFPEIG